MFFATANDIRPGIGRAEERAPCEYVVQALSDEPRPVVLQSLMAVSEFGVGAAESVVASPRYLLFRRGLLGRSTIPRARAYPQRRGPTKYAVEPTPDSLVLAYGGVHPPSGALVAGELLLPLDASRRAEDLFALYSACVLEHFTKVGHYWVGPEALDGLRKGRRLVTIGVRSPLEYDLSEA